MISHLSNPRGMALIVTLIIIVMLALIGTQLVSTTQDDVTISGNVKNKTRAFYAADAGLAIARSQLWNDYVTSTSTFPPKAVGEIGNRATYTTFLDNMGLTDSAYKVLTTSYVMADGQYIDSVTATRYDRLGGTDLVVRSIGRDADGALQEIMAMYRIQGENFRGFDFALLSNNINCIMCHATIDNVNRVYNSDPANVGTYDRVKVASLESMLIRTDAAQSKIAGTIYTRGIVTDKSGNIITNLSPTGSGVDGYEIDATNGNILEPMNTVGLTNASGSPLPQYGNLYLNYPTDQGDMTDGILPNEFPPPFPDANGNKIVDDAEFNKLAGTSYGSITGGVIYGVAKTGSFGGSSLPAIGNQASVNQTQNGNLILVGTAADPIVINGDVAVDGDVIIQGVVKGTGQIFARGNVYVTGDVTYNDGTSGGNRTYGIANDGTRNALSLTAGGNVMVGDYLTPKGGDVSSFTDVDPGNLSSGEKFSFTMSEITLFNRGEWTKTQPTLLDVNGTPVINATYVPGYKPRFYAMNNGDPVYIFNKQSTYWDPSSKSWQGSEHESSYDLTTLTKLDPGNPALSGAAVVTLSSTNSWISPETLKKLWISDEASRTSGQPFKFDGQMYTNNSIFALTRKAGKTLGKMTVNGALVAADLGVLVGGGLDLHYDARMKQFMKLKDDSKVFLDQVAWFAK